MLEVLGLNEVPLPAVIIMFIVTVAIVWTLASMRPNKGMRNAYQLSKREYSVLRQLQDDRDSGRISNDMYEQRISEIYGDRRL